MQLRQPSGTDEIAVLHQLDITDPKRLVEDDAVGMVFAAARLPPGQSHADGVRAGNADVLDELPLRQLRAGMESQGKVHEVTEISLAAGAPQGPPEARAILGGASSEALDLAIDLDGDRLAQGAIVLVEQRLDDDLALHAVHHRIKALG